MTANLWIVKHTAGASPGYTAASITAGAAWLPEGTDPAAYAAQVAAEVNANVPGAAAVVEAIDTEAEWAGALDAWGVEYLAPLGPPTEAEAAEADAAGGAA
jgi:hypothetical protein